MERVNLNDLQAFVAIAQERSFTRAAAKLGVSQSALSHTIRGVEARLGLRLLTRTTRSVAPTDAGIRLLANVGPRLAEINAELAAIAELRNKPSGTVRITSGEHAAETVLWPKLSPFLREHPDVRVEVVTEQRLTDIVADRFDAGIRLGEQIAKDMIAVRIGPDLRMAVVGSPEYFASRAAPRRPRDLIGHNCINLRMATLGGLYVWEFGEGRGEHNVRVDGRLVFNSTALIRKAALDGHGIAYLLEDLFIDDLRAGRLVRVLEEWCLPFSGYHLYFPSHRSANPALSEIVRVLRYPAPRNRSGQQGAG